MSSLRKQAPGRGLAAVASRLRCAPPRARQSSDGTAIGYVIGHVIGGGRRTLVAISLIAAIAPGSATAGKAWPPVDLIALRARDAAVLTVGYRLATSAGDLCAEKIPMIGLSVQDLDQYAPAYRAAALAMFDRADLPAVLAVAGGGAADRAGIRAGDAIAAVDGVAVPPAAPGGGLQRVEAVLARIDAAAAAGSVDLDLVRGGLRRRVQVPAVPGCVTRFQTRVAPGLNAQANGLRVEITTGLIDLAQGPDELAVVLGHEMAHNILQHRARLNAAGVRPGARSGRAARLIRQTETEADELSIYLIDRAGYSTAAPVSFWARLHGDRGRGAFAAGTHPPDADRVAAIIAQIARIADMKARRLQPRPAFPTDDPFAPLDGAAPR